MREEQSLLTSVQEIMHLVRKERGALSLSRNAPLAYLSIFGGHKDIGYLAFATDAVWDLIRWSRANELTIHVSDDDKEISVEMAPATFSTLVPVKERYRFTLTV